MGMVVNSYAFGATGPTASPHRYWRIWITMNSANSTSSFVTSVAEMEMREAVGGADVTGSGTASADSTFAGFSAAGAFANDGTTTEWASGAGVYPHWLAYDFGSGNAKAIIEINILGRSGLQTQAPGEFKIQSSDDGTTWADEWWVVYPGGSDGHNFAAGAVTFTKPVLAQDVSANRHLYWRLSMTGSNGGSFVGAREIIMRVVPGSCDETADGTATSRSNFAGLPPANAFNSTEITDTNSASEWASNNVGFPEWIQYQFARAVAITEIQMKARAGLESSQAPTGIDFQYSDDGSSWTTVKSVSSLSWTSTPKTWTIP